MILDTLFTGFLKAKYNLAKKTMFGSRPSQHQTISIFGFYLSFGIISLFLLPAYGFHYLEGWSYADSIYFTVISLTTIGFGDFSPSFEGSEETGIPFMAVYRILVLFWMMIGLAWLGSLLSITTDKFGDMMSTILGKVTPHLNSKIPKIKSLILAPQYRPKFKIPSSFDGNGLNNVRFIGIFTR